MRKYTATYQSEDDIRNFKIRITLLENGNCVEEKTFRWQEKVFGKLERTFYRDKRNCVTDLDKKYNSNVCRLTESDYILFTYTDEDKSRIGFFDDDNLDVMYIMADLSDLDSTILCTIKYDYNLGNLTVFPDFTQSEPHTALVIEDTKKTYHYYIEDASERPSESETERIDIMQLHQLKMRELEVGTDFKVPSKNRVRFYACCEILSGTNFKCANIHVKYSIVLPKDWTCSNPSDLSGTTFNSCASTSDGVFCFGYPFEVQFECDVYDVINKEAPCVYFEIVSKDSWSCFRTEGMTQFFLPISQPGVYNYELHCSRMTFDGVEGQLRRFFVGDFSSTSTFDWFCSPKQFQKNTLNKFNISATTSGRINVRLNLLRQTQPENSTSRTQANLLEEIGLITRIKEAVEAFKIAKQNMIETKIIM